MDENKENLCSRCKNEIGKTEQPQAGEPPTGSGPKEYSTLGNIMYILCLLFFLWMFGSCMSDCGHMHLGGGMCGLMGIEALLPLGAFWLYRRLNR